MDDVHRDGLTENETDEPRQGWLLLTGSSGHGVFHLGRHVEQGMAGCVSRYCQVAPGLVSLSGG